MNRKRIRAIINQKLKAGYFKNINSAVIYSHWIIMCPNRRYIKRILNQSREHYVKLRGYVDKI